MTVTGDVTMNSKLAVNGNTNLNARLTVGDVTTINARAFILGDVSMNSSLATVGNISTSSQLNVTGNTTIGAGLTVGGNSNISGKLNIGGNIPTTNAGTGSLTVTGGIGVTGNIYTNSYAYSLGFFGLSDYRIKDTVVELDDNTNIDKLRPVSYFNKLTNDNEIGFIAHEVQEVFPHLVHGEKDGDQYQSLNYPGIIALLVNEIQWLKREVVALKVGGTPDSFGTP
jgi:cytoskeletal protein CcmA (bactofilin family)